jgi:hypothetical protein
MEIQHHKLLKFRTPVRTVDYVTSSMVLIIIYLTFGLHPLIRTHILCELALIYPRRLFGAIMIKCHLYDMSNAIVLLLELIGHPPCSVRPTKTTAYPALVPRVRDERVQISLLPKKVVFAYPAFALVF